MENHNNTTFEARLLLQNTMARFNWLWRLVATAICFGLFGLAGLVLGIVVFPALWIIVHNPIRRRKIARWTVTGGFYLFIEIMNGLGVLRYRITGDEIVNTAQGCLVVANHPSLIDVVFLLSIFRDADCVVKSAMWSNPITMVTMRTIEYIPNKDPEFVMEECIKRLKAGHNLILFPEGTRSIPGKTLDFKRGAATIAIRAGSPCLPVSINCTPTTLTKNEPWYRIPQRRVMFRLDVLEPIEVQSFIDESSNEKKASLALNDYLRLALSQNLKNQSQSG